MKPIRRHAIRWTGLLLALSLVIAACSDDGGQATTTTAASTTTAATTTTSARFQKPVGGELFYGQGQEPSTLNAFLPGGNTGVAALIGSSYWTGVSRVSGDTRELIPVVVTELPTVSNGGIRVNPDGTMTVRYQIIEEAQWADGVPISGDDFRFTYDTIMDPNYPIGKGIYQDIIPESIVVGPKSFEYTMVQATVQHEFLFGVLIPRHDVQGTDFLNDYNDTMWVSGGPFMFDEWQQGSFLRVVRNPNYWRTDPETDQQLPYLDSVVFQFSQDAVALVTSFIEREVDIINPPPVVETIEALQALEGDGVRVEVSQGALWEHINFSFSERSLLRNPNSYNAHVEYRRAIAHAIDRERIIDEVVGGLVDPMDSYVDAYVPALSQGSWAQYDYDPERARQYITELCAKEGVDCVARPPTAVFTTAINDERLRISELLAEMLADVGVAYEADLEPGTIFLGATLDSGEWDLGQWGWVATPGLAGLLGIHDDFDPDVPLTGAGGNIYRYGTPAVEEGDADSLYLQGPGLVNDEHTMRFAELRDLLYATVDVDELVPYLHELEAILGDQAVFIPLYRHLDPGAVWENRVGGYVHNPTRAGVSGFQWLTQGGDTWNIELWYRADF